MKSLPASVTEVRGTSRAAAEDRLAVEAPLEIRLRAGESERSLCLTMRTPGEDVELAAGFLFTEGMLRNLAQLSGITQPSEETVVVELAADELPALGSRSFTMTSACGVCGKDTLAGLRATPAGPPAVNRNVSPRVIHRLPAALREAQAAFAATGGIHAAGLFDAGGQPLVVREDVGRHNAVDKVIGARWLTGQRCDDAILVVSGRASFELVQKALMAQIPVLAAVGAPSTLAVSLASEGGMTLLGFVRDERFNVYSGGERLLLDHG